MRITVYIATIIGLLFNFKVEAQPFTVINTNVTRGCDSLTIQFSYTTSLSVTSVMWNFGRGSSDISNLAVSNPIVYTPGLYIVTLVLNGNDTTRIRVGRPDANFTYRDTFDYGLFTIIFR
jgi:PKD repeat protein